MTRQHDGELAATLSSAVHAPDHASREALSGVAYLAAARARNALQVTEHVEEALGHYDVRINGARRPCVVLNANRFAEGLQRAMPVSALTRLGLVGSIDQPMAPTDELIHFTDWPARLERVYDDKLGEDPYPGSRGKLHQ